MMDTLTDATMHSHSQKQSVFDTFFKDENGEDKPQRPHMMVDFTPGNYHAITLEKNSLYSAKMELHNKEYNAVIKTFGLKDTPPGKVTVEDFQDDDEETTYVNTQPLQDNEDYYDRNIIFMNIKKMRPEEMKQLKTPQLRL